MDTTDTSLPFLSKDEEKSGIKIENFEKFESETEKNSGECEDVYVRRQILASFTIVCCCIVGAMVAGFSGVLLPQLQADDSIIKLTKEQESWIAAMAPFQMSLGCLISTWTMDKFGRKKCNITGTFLAFLGWGVIYCSTSVSALFIGRVLGGLSVGISGMPSTAYMAEIASTTRRGLFLSFVAFGIAGGVFIVHLLGTFFTWQTTALVAMVLSIIVMGLLCYLPESHAWYLNQNQIGQARKSFDWFRGRSELEVAEFNRSLKKTGTKLTLPETLAECNKQEFYHPLLILLLFFTTTQVTGTNVVTFYSVELMQLTVPSLDKYVAMIIVDVCRVLVSILASVLTTRYRVRVLLFTSAVGTIASLFALSFFVYMGQKYPENRVYTTIPLVFLMTYILFISIGLVPLPWTVCGEILPSATKGIGGGLACAMNFLVFFGVIKTGPFLFGTLGTHGTFGLYGILVTIGTIGLFYLLPETKNRSLQEIQEFFIPKRLKTIENCDDMSLKPK